MDRDRDRPPRIRRSEMMPAEQYPEILIEERRGDFVPIVETEPTPETDLTISQDYTGGYAEHEKSLLSAASMEKSHNTKRSKVLETSHSRQFIEADVRYRPRGRSFGKKPPGFTNATTERGGLQDLSTPSATQADVTNLRKRKYGATSLSQIREPSPPAVGQYSHVNGSPPDDYRALLHKIPESQPTVESLLHELETLKKENLLLQMQVRPEIGKPVDSSSNPWILVHSLQTTFYFDAPQWKQIQNGSWRLESREPIFNFEIFLEKQKLGGVSFVVILNYDDPFGTRHRKHTADQHEDGNAEEPFQIPSETTTRPLYVSIQFLCEILAMAWSNLIQTEKVLKQSYDLEGGREKDDYSDVSSVIDSPVYDRFPQHQRSLENAEVFFYHFQTLIWEKISAMEASNEKSRLNLLMRFVGHHFRDEYQDAESLFENGLVSSKYAKYLSGPESVLVARENGNDIGYLQKTFFRNVAGTSWSANAMSLAFDGKFKASDKRLKINVEDTPKRISSLNFYPLKYADPHVAQTLEARGRKFWACRKSAYVSYTGLDMNKETAYDDTRFVIDVRTYHTMHGTMIGAWEKPPMLDNATFNCDEPPDNGSFVYLVPASIYGFEMQEKKWVNLQVDNINQLEWDTEAFESLAIDEESMEMINALVNNKITAEKATDMVRGKGNGLIILLHGGPGTGKTLTAESVAEIAKKPLYRVTCGDIGTEPREVEKYLQQVFHLGKIWDCVVLLDEADVFLEQRTLSDLSRNALVSVFLRTLEYYDGILILTSNRVGTFDEAFKSRIQIALHYPNLTSYQRQQIWNNFIHRLDSLGEDVDIHTILDSINKLAKYEMNGRQIRNAITTARQLALFKKETLTTKHLEHSIRVSGKFDQYLDEVHDQIKDDDMARQNAIR